MPDETIQGAPAPVETAAPAPVAAEVTATEAPEGEQAAPVEETPEKTWEKARRKMERRIDNLTRRNGELMAHVEHSRAAQRPSSQTEGEPPPQQDQQGVPHEEAVYKAAQHLREIETVNQRSNEVARAGMKEYPDFLDRFKELQAGLGKMYKPDGRPTPLMEAILDSDAPTKVLYALANDLDLAAEVAALSPHRMTRRLVALEAELSAKPKPSAAPKPVSSVKPTPADSDPDPSDTAAWIEKRNRKLKERA